MAACALVAAAIASVATVNGDPGDPVAPERPVPIRTTLADGTSIVGPLTRWDDAGFEATVDGTVRSFRWEELRPVEVYRIRKRLIDELAASGAPTVDAERLARRVDLFVWLASGDERDLTARAERDARSAGADDAAITAAREQAASLRAERASKAEAARRAALRTTTPEGDTFDTTPWQPQSMDERAKRVTELKVMTASKLAAAGREATPIEGRQAIVYSDLGASDAATRAVDIDHFVANALPRLGVSGESQPFWGKVVVIVVEGDDRFRLLEASGFRQEVTKADTVLTHYDGGRAFVVVRTQPDVVSTTLAMYRGVALAILHSHVSATRLPPWANEGIADWLVAMYPRGKAIDEPLRKPGLRFIRNGGSIEGVMGLTYAPGSWPGPEGIGRNVGFLVSGFIAEKEPTRFQAWVRAVKAGTPWEQALVEELGLSPTALLDAVRRHYRTND